MSFFSLTPHPSVSPIDFSLLRSPILPSAWSCLSLIPPLSAVCLPGCLPVFGFFIYLLFYFGLFLSSHSTCMHTNTKHTLLWNTPHLPLIILSLSLSSCPLCAHTPAHHTLTPGTGRWSICQASCRSVPSQFQWAPSCPGRSDPKPEPQHRQRHCPHRHPLPAPSMLRHSLRPDCAALLRTHKSLRADPQNENDHLHHLTSHPKVIHTIEDKNESLVSNACRQMLSWL